MDKKKLPLLTTKRPVLGTICPSLMVKGYTPFEIVPKSRLDFAVAIPRSQTLGI